MSNSRGGVRENNMKVEHGWRRKNRRKGVEEEEGDWQGMGGRG